ncbi:gamma-glutamyl-gamma-aminobutyrate hydrolase [Arthrobacter sp. SW1]|uniref:gamma-glutamyl-gamma-aminobutyrate hydrolase family protein n=1 Tax=Arthrobacter sp. SW1 TaxID=1920889 RepID=UPI000877DA79|nr:gamma-glutamyl-gamma-aminobutyrate hydrolase family protein [Arthrobacter sp. SW1]OFI37577.1 gamma-glutamyl-gamma-aminobutyrate hydrolase [Arthrobacter sp. SW1]
MQAHGSPRIGVPVRLSSSEGADPRVGKANHLFELIVELLRQAGAEPVLLDSLVEPGNGGAVRELDGVLLPGGGDLDPGLYGEEPGPELYDVNPAQDELDMSVAKAGIAAGIPVLGICRGHQLLNVLYGGTLIQDMHPSPVVHRVVAGEPAPDPEHEWAEHSWAWHDVGLTAGSRLAALYGGSAPSVRIASGHHQAVARVGNGLLVTAVADDGTIEGLEDPARWVVSMQWHPEAASLPEEQRLAPFRAFVEVCREAGGG